MHLSITAGLATDKQYAAKPHCRSWRADAQLGGTHVWRYLLYPQTIAPAQDKFLQLTYTELGDALQAAGLRGDYVLLIHNNAFGKRRNEFRLG